MPSPVKCSAQHYQRRSEEWFYTGEHARETGDQAEQTARHVHNTFARLDYMRRHPVARFGANYRVIVSLEIPH